jgi:hypothetical protein
MSGIRLEEIFITQMELEEFLRSMSNIIQAWCDYCDNAKSQKEMDKFCNCISSFIVMNADQLKCLLRFFEENITEYQKHKEALDENNKS